MTVSAINYETGIVTYTVEMFDGEVMEIPTHEDWDVIPTLFVGKEV